MNVSKFLQAVFLIIMSSAIFAQSKSVNDTNKTFDNTKNNKQSSANYKKTLIKISATEIVKSVAEDASKLSNDNQKVTIKLQAAKILAQQDLPAAVKLLESAWKDANLALQKNPVPFNELALRSNVISVAKEIAPEQARKWSKQIDDEKRAAKEKSGEDNDKSSEQVQQKAADILAQRALSEIESNAPKAVDDAISSFTQTGRYSQYLSDVLRDLNEKNQLELSSKLKQNLADYVFDKITLEANELKTIITFALSNEKPDAIGQNKLLTFLMNSTEQILSNRRNVEQPVQNSEDNFKELFIVYKVFLKPAVAKYTPEILPKFESLLSELSDFLPHQTADEPIFSLESPEKQIEKAIKITGIEARDKGLAKIAGQLLSPKMRGSENSKTIELAKQAISEMSISDAKDDLYDYVKLVETELLVKNGYLYAAEKKVDAITKPELRAWALMALGSVQKNKIEVANRLYFESIQTLRKAPPSPFKTETAFNLTALKLSITEQSALEDLDESVKIANQVSSDYKFPNRDFVIYATIGENRLSIGFGDAEIENIILPSALSKIGVRDWNETSLIGKSIENQVLRSRFLLLTAKAVLSDDNSQKPIVKTK